MLDGGESIIMVLIRSFLWNFDVGISIMVLLATAMKYHKDNRADHITMTDDAYHCR